MRFLSLLTTPWVRNLGLLCSAMALAFLMWQSDEPTQPLDSAAALRGEAEPDGFVVNGRYLSFDETGKLTIEFESPRIEQFESRQVATMESPTATLYGDAGEPPWDVRADRGRFEEPENLIHLSGDVTVVRETGAGRTATLTTPRLTLDNGRRVAYTDAPVKLTDDHSVTRATGMTAWIDERILELDSQVEGHYEPAK